MDTEALLVSTAVESREAALELARSAMEARLAASVQIGGPVTSLFWHLGEYGEGTEWVVLFRTSAQRYADLESHILANHPWKNPEIVAVPFVAGSAAYLDWIRQTVNPE